MSVKRDIGVLLRRSAELALFCAFLAAAPVFTGQAEGRSVRHSPRHAAMILDANTGAVLHEEDGDQPRHPASLTKMMTLYLTFETLEQGRMAMSSMVKISQEAASVAPSKLDLDPGEEISVSDAVRALITKSANDVAVALAEKIGGSQANFVRLMNAKARDLGMNKTNFENASGLPDPDQVTTARDMITLALHLQDDFPQHYPLFALRAFSYKGHSHRNHNTLMNNFAGIDGIKTGYTRASGFNLVTSVRRGGRHLVGAVFGGPSAATRNGEMRMLLTRALNRASTTKTRKSAPMLVAKLKGEPKRAERPAQKELAKKELAQVELVAKEADQKPRWVTVAAPAAQPNVEPMPKPSVKAKVRPPAAAPMQAAAKTGTAGEPAAAASVTADTAPPSASGAVPVEVTPVEVTPVEVTKVRRVMVAPRQGPKRPPPGPAETTDMASSDDGSDDNANGSDLGLPEISETIVPKNDAPARPMFAAAGESKASMLGAADVTPPVTVAETGEAASAVIEVAPAVAVPAAKPALKTVPAAAAAIAPAVQSS
ncbi:MAG: D-alanyl-D-alanine carboxypeptidase family protein, partial [Hyphomicrobium sp.]